MSVRFYHPPRTGGTSIRAAWRPTRHELVGHRKPPAEKPAGEFWYSCTRNPWDRAVSLYFLRHQTEWSRTEEPFRGWLLGGMVNRAEPRDEHADAWQELCAPTTDWNRGADLIVRFEHRESDLTRLAGLLGRDVPRGHEAASRGRVEYPAYYDGETIAYVRERYASDVDAFGYTFEGALCMR